MVIAVVVGVAAIAEPTRSSEVDSTRDRPAEVGIDQSSSHSHHIKRSSRPPPEVLAVAVVVVVVVVYASVYRMLCREVIVVVLQFCVAATPESPQTR